MDEGSLRVVWENNWHPKYKCDEEFGSEQFRSITPHFARHWMTTLVRTKKGWDEPLVQCLRVDKTGQDIGTRRLVMHRCVHSTCRDVEERYRDDNFDVKI